MEDNYPYIQVLPSTRLPPCLYCNNTMTTDCGDFISFSLSDNLSLTLTLHVKHSHLPIALLARLLHLLNLGEAAA